MWIADNWKDYEVIDCFKRRKARALGRLSSRPSRPAGHLGHAEDRARLAQNERPLPPQRQGRRGVGIF